MSEDSSPERLATHLRGLARDLPAGGRLPSTRTIAARWGASPVTVQRAVRILVAEGLVETRPGAGNFIRHARPAARADYGWQTTALGPARIDRGAIGSTLRQSPDDVISLRESYPSDDLLPVRAVRAALTRAAALARGGGSPAPRRDCRSCAPGSRASSPGRRPTAATRRPARTCSWSRAARARCRPPSAPSRPRARPS